MYSYTNSKQAVYYLHGRDVVARGGRKMKLYFFAKTIKEGALQEIPQGYKVIETASGLPLLKKV